MVRQAVPGPSWALTNYDRPPHGAEDDSDDDDDDDLSSPRYHQTVGAHGFIVLPGDIDIEEDVNLCTLGPGTYRYPTFDYVEFMEYNQLRMLLFQVTKQQTKAPYKDPGPACPEFLKQKFRKEYGNVDFDTDQMKLVLESVKQTILEQARQDPYDPEIMVQLMELNIQADDPFVAEKQLTELINRKFDEEKREMYSTFNPRQSKGEWFVLPRGHPAEILDQHFKEHPLGHGSRRKEPKGPLTNLHLYDPKFDFCFTYPFRIFTMDYKGWEIYKDIPRLLRHRIIEHLNDFPFGVNPTVFWETYMKKYGHIPSIENLTSLQILEQFPDEIWFPAPSSLHFPRLIYLGFLENVVDPLIVLKTAWHHIYCIVGRVSFILVDSLIELLAEMYNFRFDPKHWGFDKMVSFVKFCNKKFGTLGLWVHRVHCTVEGEVRRFDYVMIESDSLKRHVESLHGLHDLKLPTLKPVPDDYLGHLEVIDALSNHCSKGDQLVATLTHMTDPFNMFVVLRMYYKRLQSFMDEIQRDREIRRSPPNPNVLAVGMYVLAYTKDYSKYEWYRVKVTDIRKGNAGTCYTVYSIDYGFQSKVQLADIRLMPRGILSEELAYAIPVRLKMEHPNRKQKIGQPKKASKVMYGLCEGKVLIMRLINGRLKDSMGCMKWKISSSLANPRPPVEIMNPLDLASLYVTEYFKVYPIKTQNNPERVVEAEASVDPQKLIPETTTEEPEVSVSEQQEVEVSISEEQETEVSIPKQQEVEVSISEEQEAEVSISEEQEVEVSISEGQEVEVSISEEQEVEVSISEEQETEVSIPKQQEVEVSISEEQEVEVYGQWEVEVDVYEQQEVEVSVPEQQEGEVSISEEQEVEVSISEEQEVEVYGQWEVEVDVYEQQEVDVSVPEQQDTEVSISEQQEVEVYGQWEDEVDVYEQQVIQVSVPEQQVTEVSIPKQQEVEVRISEQQETKVSISEQTEVEVSVSEQHETTVGVDEQKETKFKLSFHYQQKIKLNVHGQKAVKINTSKQYVAKTRRSAKVRIPEHKAANVGVPPKNSNTARFIQDVFEDTSVPRQSVDEVSIPGTSTGNRDIAWKKFF